MMPRAPYELPEDKQRKIRKAIRLEWITIFFLVTIGVVMYLAMGQSQAMKAAWIEDVLSLIPPIVFLISIRYRSRPPDERFPFGLRRAPLLAFLASSAAVTVLGLYILGDSVIKLASAHHPSIGMMEIFGWRMWAGWVMIAALVYSMVPPLILGRMKLPLSRELHEKTLHADAAMNKADWMTGGAAIIGIVGIGFGWWWADGVAAGLIALDVIYDGATHVRDAIFTLLDQRPTQVESHKPDEAVEARLLKALRSLDWVEDAAVRVREEGQLYSGEAFVVSRDGPPAPRQLADASRRLCETDWRAHAFVVQPVDTTPSREEPFSPDSCRVHRCGLPSGCRRSKLRERKDHEDRLDEEALHRPVERYLQRRDADGRGAAQDDR